MKYTQREFTESSESVDSQDSITYNKDDTETEEYASFVEKTIATFIAPEALSQQGRFFIIVLWSVLIICSIAGAQKLEMNFSIEYYIPIGSILLDYIELDIKHYQTGYQFNLLSFVVNEDMS